MLLKVVLLVQVLFHASTFSSVPLLLVKAYTFAVIPKRMDSPFFAAVGEGCIAQAANLDNVTCIYRGPAVRGDNATDLQMAILEELWDELDGFAIAVLDADATSTIIEKAMAAHKFAVTFDSDAADSLRHAYVGTENKKFGQELAHVLLQLAPGGGTYAIVSSSNGDGFDNSSNVSPNLWARMEGIRDGLQQSGWHEASSVADALGDSNSSLAAMEELMLEDPEITAIVPVGGWPMYEPDGWERFVNQYPQVTTVCGDALEVQIMLMNRGSANGLVGQLPFQFGAEAINVLYELTVRQEQGIEPSFAMGSIFATPVLNVLQMPQDIPPLEIDMNYLGGLSILGWILSGMVILLSMACAAWTLQFQNRRVVKASQPVFLCLICFGVMLMGSAMIPLGFDDQRFTTRQCSIACMAVPWLVSIGFATTFSALFSKTWRINKVHAGARRFQRIRVTAQDVSVPLGVLLTLNLLVLLLWTFIAPLQYERRANSGTDNWNRSSRSYYGACFGPPDAVAAALSFAACLVVINFIVLVIANLQAYQARKITTEFSESRYIAFIMVTMLQASIVGVPVLILIHQDPRAYFIVVAVILSVTCMATLLFLFVPKMSKRNETVGRSQQIITGLSDVSGQLSAQMSSGALGTSSSPLDRSSLAPATSARSFATPRDIDIPAVEAAEGMTGIPATVEEVTESDQVVEAVDGEIPALEATEGMSIPATVDEDIGSDQIVEAVDHIPAAPTEEADEESGKISV